MKMLSDSGSILLEVILTILILSVGIGVIVQSFGINYRASARAVQGIETAMLLENQMTGWIFEGGIASGFEDTKALAEPWNNYSYTVKSQAYDDFQEQDFFNHVTVGIFDSDRPGALIASAETFLFNSSQ